MIFKLAYTHEPRGLSGAQFLELVGATDGHRLTRDLLRDALGRKSADDMECAMILHFEFGVQSDEILMLGEAAHADWHHPHNDVVTMLQECRASEAIPILAAVARHPPRSLDEIDSATLTKNAVWAIYTIGGPAVEEALTSAAGEDTEAGRLSAQLVQRMRSESRPSPEP